ncbi:patatin-like phospholipase family protein [Streptomyces sp. RB6PN25]|uniref:Patatin-like phospholipase family protein n=1 Tax=Streptomyces humicola TaxID=2953240 RepID=A0ABT1PPJ1_9ACTN|nr:patatin-like phospholipase family protein [Streptomyces humicola]MCQ4079594.1 patatin-like phospholipase family protein [Streptomyces humicola]
MTTAFVLWGGGSMGAAQVGMLRGLTARGIRPDLVIGASVGALNAAYYAALPDTQGVEELAELWLRVSEHDVYPLNSSQVLHTLADSLPGRPLRGVLRALGGLNYIFPINPLMIGLAAAGRTNHLFDNHRFRRYVENVLPLERLEQARLPVKILATDVCNGEGVLLSRGEAVPALMASTAVPGFYPSVEIGGRHLMDGSVSSNTTLDHAIELGADEVYLLTPGYSCPLPAPPSTVLAIAVHTYNLLGEQRMAASIANARTQVRLYPLPALCPMEVLPIDFRQTARLIEQATESTLYWLDNDRQAQPGAARALGDFRTLS